MTFHLVIVDTSRDDHLASFPKQSFYIQESRLTGAQNMAFRKAALGDGTYASIDWGSNAGHPSEWREWSRYAQALSKFDAEYDYSLPSRSQWTFACKSGYDQSCDKTKPNAYGILGMSDTNGCAEPIDEMINRDGAEFAVLMGYWKDNWGEHRGETRPKCSCEYWTASNPDADDSLNEIISGRFIMAPKKALPADPKSSG